MRLQRFNGNDPVPDFEARIYEKKCKESETYDKILYKKQHYILIVQH